MEKKYTPIGQSYWGAKGAYQKEHDELFKKLVLDNGKANTVHGELLNSIGVLYYEYANNGNGNAVQEITRDCPECHGSGYEDNDDADDCPYCDGDCTVPVGKEFRKDYQEHFDFIKKTLPKEDQNVITELEDFCLKDIVINDDLAVYDQVMDAIMHFILTTENKEL